MLPGDLLQRGNEFGGAGDAERDGLPTGFLGALALGLRFPAAALAVRRQGIVVGVVAVLGLGAPVAAGCGGGLLGAGVGAGPGVVAAGLTRLPAGFGALIPRWGR